MRVRCLEQCLCVTVTYGSKFVLNIQATAEELSLHYSKHDSGNMLPSNASTQIVTICAMNSNTLFMDVLRREGVM